MATVHNPQGASAGNFVFIVGCPRSGTYLLTSILIARLQMAIPVETHFIPLFRKYAWLFGDLSRVDKRRRLLNCIFRFLKIFTPRSEQGRDYEKVREFSLLAVEDAADEIIARSTNYGELVRELFAAYGRFRNSGVLGDKSAIFHHVNPDHLAEGIAGDSKFIHLVRDGRDVAVSWMNIWSGPKFTAQAAKAWRRHVEGNRSWGARHPDRYLEIRYEDLLSRHEDTLTRIADFLDIPITAPAEAVHHHELTRLLAKSSSNTHDRLAGPVQSDNQQKWKSRMSIQDQMLFSSVAGQTLASFGYEPGVYPSNPAMAVQNRVRVISAALIAPFTPHQIKLRLKHFLPALLYAQDRVFGIFGR